MPSPFPGMDPYIESSGRWGDFHDSTIAAIRGQLNARLPKGYAATIEAYVLFQEPETRKRRYAVPDIYVAEESPGRKARSSSLAIAAPETIVLASIERKRHRYIEVIDLEANRVVTAIELLSPGNKSAGEEREAYLAKRSECLDSKVSFVEIDLLRGGRRMPLSDPPPDIEDYYIMVSRAWEYPRAAFWSFTIRSPLPEIPIPLTKELPDVMLPLRPCVDRAYDEGLYSTRLPYDKPLKPRLRKADADWVRDLLAAWRLTESS